MLGNIRPYLPRLSRQAKTEYSAYYCGLCKSLGRQNGVISRFMLNYDMAFRAIIYDELQGAEYKVKRSGCFANPFKKKDILIPTAGTLYAADVLIMLAYFKLIDNIRDEKPLKKAGYKLLQPYFYFKYRQAAKRHPRLARELKQQSANQLQAENETADIDILSMPTAKMVKAILSRCATDENKLAVSQFGFFLGRVIYLMDALIDRREDEKDNKFNIFNIKNYSEEEAKAECFMALGEMAHWYSRLDIKKHKEIADNIIYMSLARKIKFAGEEKVDNNGE